MLPCVLDYPCVERAAVQEDVLLHKPCRPRVLLWVGEGQQQESPPSSASSFPVENGRLLMPGGQIYPMHSPVRGPLVPRMYPKPSCPPGEKPCTSPAPVAKSHRESAHGGISVPPSAVDPTPHGAEQEMSGLLSRSLSQGTAGWAPPLCAVWRAPGMAPKPAGPQALSWVSSLPHGQPCALLVPRQ